MPYESDAQRRFMHARHPGIASRWDEEIREGKKGRKKHRRAQIEEMAKADFFGRQGLKNAAARLRTADKLADATPSTANVESAKFAARMRNKALRKVVVRTAPVAAVPLLGSAYAGSEATRRRMAPPQTYNSGAYVEGTGQ